jgi:hypothetical protein
VNRFALPLAFTLVAALSAAPAVLQAVETMTWQDLLPPRQLEVEEALDAEQRKLWAFDEAKREGFYEVTYELDIRTGLKDGSLEDADLTEEDRAILKSEPSKQFPEAVIYWKGMAALRSDLAAAAKEVPMGMSGRQVRIAGYVLPLEFAGEEVTEFLLVPFVGACIHAPAPPPNQIVHVRPAKPFESDRLYAPVWVDGVLSTGTAKHDLSLVDGTAPVEVGYAMDAAAVEAYKRK